MRNYFKDAVKPSTRHFKVKLQMLQLLCVSYFTPIFPDRIKLFLDIFVQHLIQGLLLGISHDGNFRAGVARRCTVNLHAVLLTGACHVPVQPLNMGLFINYWILARLALNWIKSQRCSLPTKTRGCNQFKNWPASNNTTPILYYCTLYLNAFSFLPFWLRDPFPYHRVQSF